MKVNVGDKIKSRVCYDEYTKLNAISYYWLTVTDYDTIDMDGEEVGIVTAENELGETEEMFADSIFFNSPC